MSKAVHRSSQRQRNDQRPIFCLLQDNSAATADIDLFSAASLYLTKALNALADSPTNLTHICRWPCGSRFWPSRSMGLGLSFWFAMVSHSVPGGAACQPCEK